MQGKVPVPKQPQQQHQAAAKPSSPSGSATGSDANNNRPKDWNNNSNPGPRSANSGASSGPSSASSGHAPPAKTQTGAASPTLSRRKHPNEGQNLERAPKSPPKAAPQAAKRPLPHVPSESQQSKLSRLVGLMMDGPRKTPQYYRDLCHQVSSPSQLSTEGMSDKYTLNPGTSFQLLEDVYSFRGYRKLARLDEGAFGVVCKAVRLSDQLQVATKEIDLSKKPAKRHEEMKRELYVIQRVEGKNVVRLLEHFVVNEILVIVMEFCAGGNLSNLLKEMLLTEEEIQNLFVQMVRGIKALHRKGIAHRDIKLNNFLLDASRRTVKVADFGLSVVSWRASRGLLFAKSYCGTEPYMAPEVLKRNSRNLRSYNPFFADVWSLGVCLFAIMTRTFPFNLELNQKSLYRAQKARRWRLPKVVRGVCSEEVNDLVWHMLDPEANRRISLNSILQHPWLNAHTPYQFSAVEMDSRAVLMTTSVQKSPATRL